MVTSSTPEVPTLSEGHLTSLGEPLRAFVELTSEAQLQWLVDCRFAGDSILALTVLVAAWPWVDQRVRDHFLRSARTWGGGALAQAMRTREASPEVARLIAQRDEQGAR